MKIDILTKTDLRYLDSKLEKFENMYIKELKWLNNLVAQLQDRVKMLEDKLDTK